MFEVLRIVGEERMLIKSCKERQKKWVGHILRHDGLLKDVIEGRLERKRLRGRKRIMMLDSIKGREPYQRMKERAQDRQGWSDYQNETCWTAVHYRETMFGGNSHPKFITAWQLSYQVCFYCTIKLYISYQNSIWWYNTSSSDLLCCLIYQIILHIYKLLLQQKLKWYSLQ